MTQVRRHVQLVRAAGSSKRSPRLKRSRGLRKAGQKTKLPTTNILFFAEVTRHMFEIVFREYLRNYEELGHGEGMCGYI